MSQEDQFKIETLEMSLLPDQFANSGVVVSGQGISVDHSKIKAVQAFPVPSSVKEVQHFFGLCIILPAFREEFCRFDALCADGAH